MTNKEKISAVFFEKGSWSLFNESDREWLMTSANEGDLQAACLLINGMHYKYHCWTEKFVDEDTNEEFEVNRNEKTNDGTTFEPDEEAEARLRQMVFDGKERLSDEELWWACCLIDQATPLYLERIRRGEEDAAYHIDDPAILQELCDKGNKTAFEQMWYKYAYGDEANGIFIDPKKAKEYHEKGHLDCEYEPYEMEFPCESVYVLRGSAEELEAVKTLAHELTNRYGTPDNEFGLYVPMEILMQTLVGSKYYKGNLLSMDTDRPDCIVLRAEADSPEPLLYALRQAFPNLEVEIEDEDEIEDEE